MNNTRNVIIDSFILIFASIRFLTSAEILFLIVYQRHRSRIRTLIFLICNTYLSVIFICMILLDMYAHNLYGDLYSNVSFNSEWCYGRTYIWMYIYFEISS